MIGRAAWSSRCCCNIMFDSSFICVRSLIWSYFRVTTLKLLTDDDIDDDELFLWHGWPGNSQKRISSRDHPQETSSSWISNTQRWGSIRITEIAIRNGTTTTSRCYNLQIWPSNLEQQIWKYESDDKSRS